MSSTIIKPEDLEKKIIEGIPQVSFVKAIDMSDGCGAKFEIEVMSETFMGKSILMQHRIVHKAIEEERKHIHALTLRTKVTSMELTAGEEKNLNDEKVNSEDTQTVQPVQEKKENDSQNSDSIIEIKGSSS